MPFVPMAPQQRVLSVGRAVPDIGLIVATSWSRWASTRFRGSDVMRLPTNIKFYLQTTGSGTVDVRMYDVTNSQVIGTRTTLSGARALYDLGALANIPAGEADWEFQIQASGVGLAVNIEKVETFFE